MAMVILVSFLGLEGQTSSSQEDLPLSHQLSIVEGRKMTKDILLSFLGLEGQTTSSIEDVP